MKEYKGLGIEKQKAVMAYRIRAVAQGSIPSSLAGIYTSEREAMKAIDACDTRRGRKRKNAKSVSASGD